MDVSTIYKENKLYRISETFEHQQGTQLTVPEGFSGVATIYEYEPADKLSDDLSAFLRKFIEGGMKLDPDKVLSANLCYTDVSLRKLSEQAKAKIVVIFGLKWLDNLHNANIRKNEIVKLYGMKVLVTDSLDIINTSDIAKKAFWVELKKIF
jgi:hypothetical protein